MDCFARNVTNVNKLLREWELGITKNIENFMKCTRAVVLN